MNEISNTGLRHTVALASNQAANSPQLCDYQRSIVTCLTLLSVVSVFSVHSLLIHKFLLSVFAVALFIFVSCGELREESAPFDCYAS